MLYLTCTTITSVDFAHYGVSRAKDWVSVDCGTISVKAVSVYIIAKMQEVCHQYLIMDTFWESGMP